MKWAVDDDHVKVPRVSRGLLVAALAIAWLGSTAVPARVAGQPPTGLARSVAGRLLVATEDMRDPRFAESVIYMVRHDATGALGLVVNRPLQPMSLALLLERLGMPGANAPGDVLVHWGGPVETGRAFALHTPEYRAEGTVVVKERVAFTGSRKILEAMATRAGPRRLLFAIGYAGWAPGQLEAELERGGWLTAGADEDVLFDGDHASKWRRRRGPPSDGFVDRPRSRSAAAPGRDERWGFGGHFGAHIYRRLRISSLAAARRWASRRTTKPWNWMATAGCSRSRRAKRSALRRRTRHGVSATTSAERG